MATSHRSGICACGCGQSTPIAKLTNTKRGDIKGHPTRFMLGHHVEDGNRKRYAQRGRGVNAPHCV